jgi:NAD(P)-dependent dehydrogenase (short-subunit alcohol dehydrogenase family)
MGTATPQDFVGKVALVTGAGSGIGRAGAELFAARGAKVAVTDIRREPGLETVARIEQAGGTAIFIETDVTSEAAVKAMIAGTLNVFGGLDCAFNNAGYGGRYMPFWELSEAEWDHTIDTTLKSTFLCMKHEIIHMLSVGGGAIVNTASGAGFIASPGMPAYTAAKHGVLGLMKVGAKELAQHNIRVNAICPGITDTPMARAFIGNDAALEKMMMDTSPMGRMGKPEEMAQAAVWLCSDAASFVSGESMLVDGASVCR